MTANQIALAALRENERSHRATEALKGVELSEIERSHRENEAVNWFSAGNTGQHYQRMDQETNRSNLENEAIRRVANANQATANAIQKQNVANQNLNNLWNQQIRDKEVEYNYKLGSDRNYVQAWGTVGNIATSLADSITKFVRGGSSK